MSTNKPKFMELTPEKQHKVIGELIYNIGREGSYDFSVALKNARNKQSDFLPLSTYLAYFLSLLEPLPTAVDIHKIVVEYLVGRNASDMFKKNSPATPSCDNQQFYNEEAGKVAKFYMALTDNLASTNSILLKNPVKVNSICLQYLTCEGLIKRDIPSVNTWLKKQPTSYLDFLQKKKDALKDGVKKRSEILQKIQQHKYTSKEEKTKIAEVISNLESFILSENLAEDFYAASFNPLQGEGLKQEKEQIKQVADQMLKELEQKFLSQATSDSNPPQSSRNMQVTAYITRIRSINISDTHIHYSPTELKLEYYRALKQSGLENHRNGDIKQWCGRFKQALGLGAVGILYALTFGRVPLLVRAFDSLHLQVVHNTPKTCADVEALLKQRVGIIPPATLFPSATVR